MPRGQGLWSPTLDAMELRQGWGTHWFADGQYPALTVATGERAAGSISMRANHCERGRDTSTTPEVADFTFCVNAAEVLASNSALPEYSTVME
jgi:hypothetical protein